MAQKQGFIRAMHTLQFRSKHMARHRVAVPPRRRRQFIPAWWQRPRPAGHDHRQALKARLITAPEPAMNRPFRAWRPSAGCSVPGAAPPGWYELAPAAREHSRPSARCSVTCAPQYASEQCTRGNSAVSTGHIIASPCLRAEGANSYQPGGNAPGLPATITVKR